jgi:hypothetical protein
MKMKTILTIAAGLLIALVACEKEEDYVAEFLSGTYEGTLTYDSNLKSTIPFTGGTHSASAEITAINDDLIEVHCYSTVLDTTFMLNIYSHNDSVNVCLTGSDFTNMYGHMLGQGHMGGMMEDIANGQTNWMHHMNDEHQTSDEHFGGFNLDDHSFGYRIKMMDGDNPYYWNFQGEIK